MPKDFARLELKPWIRVNNVDHELYSLRCWLLQIFLHVFFVDQFRRSNQSLFWTCNSPARSSQSLASKSSFLNEDS